MDSQEAKRAHILLLLSDSNIPTGGFVASAGLEAYYAHGFLGARTPAHGAPNGSDRTGGPWRLPNQAQLAASTLSYATYSLTSYARSSLAFISDAHALCCAAISSIMDERVALDSIVSRVLEGLDTLDSAYHALTTNHVVRRASLAQGVALLTLYSKAFAQIEALPLSAYTPGARQGSSVIQERRRSVAAKLVDAYKLAVRKEHYYGHLPICWGVFTAALGLDRASSLHLHLFLVSRSLLSSSVRLNTMGPYMAQQLTLFNLPPIVDAALAAAQAAPMRASSSAVTDEELHPTCTTALVCSSHATLRGRATLKCECLAHHYNASPSSSPGCPADQHLATTKIADPPVDDMDESQGWAWDWADDGAWALGWDDPPGAEDNTRTATGDTVAVRKPCPFPPAQTWPLGELVQGRHDQLHSRLFNS